MKQPGSLSYYRQFNITDTNESRLVFNMSIISTNFDCLFNIRHGFVYAMSITSATLK